MLFFGTGPELSCDLSNDLLALKVIRSLTTDVDFTTRMPILKALPKFLIGRRRMSPRAEDLLFGILGLWQIYFWTRHCVLVGWTSAMGRFC